MESVESVALWNSCNSECIKSALSGHPNRQLMIEKLGLSNTFGIAWPERAIKGVTEFVLAFDAETRTAWFRGRKFELMKDILRDAFQLPHGEFSAYLQRWRHKDFHNMFNERSSSGNPHSINGLNPPYDEWKEVIRLVQKVILGNGRPTLVTGKVMRYFYAYFVWTLLGSDRRKKRVKMPDWADLVLDELTLEMKKLKKHLTRPVERHVSYCGTAITYLLLFWGYTWESLNGDGAGCNPVDGGTINICSLTAVGGTHADAATLDCVANDGGEGVGLNVFPLSGAENGTVGNLALSTTDTHGHWSAGGADESAGEDSGDEEQEHASQNNLEQKTLSPKSPPELCVELGPSVELCAEVGISALEKERQEQEALNKTNASLLDQVNALQEEKKQREALLEETNALVQVGNSALEKERQEQEALRNINASLVNEVNALQEEKKQREALVEETNALVQVGNSALEKERQEQEALRNINASLVNQVNALQEEKKQREALVEDTNALVQVGNSTLEKERQEQEALHKLNASLVNQVNALQEEKSQLEDLVKYRIQMCAEAESKVHSLERVGEQLALVISDRRVQVESLLTESIHDKSALRSMREIAVVLHRLLQEKLASTKSLEIMSRLRQVECRIWKLHWKDCRDAYVTQILKGVRKEFEMERFQGTIPHHEAGSVKPGNERADGNAVPVRIDESEGSPQNRADGNVVPVRIDQSKGLRMRSADGNKVIDLSESPPKKRQRPQTSVTTTATDKRSPVYGWLHVKPQNKVSTNDVRVPCMPITSAIPPLLPHPLQTLVDDSELEEEVTIPTDMVRNVDIHKHQAKGIAWMCGRESKQKEKFPYAFGGFTYSFPDPRGGFLSDDQGMGKTVQIIGMMLLHRNPDKPTLICCPKAVVVQWTLELRNKISDTHRFRVGVYGEDKLRDAEQMSRLEIVITTYASVHIALRHALALEDKKGAKKKRRGGKGDDDLPLQWTGPFENTDWGRIILDECHAIKNRRSDTAIAISRLRADFRWCVSGTLFSNTENEAFSYFTFLRYKPLGDEDSQKQHTKQHRHKTVAERHMALHRHVAPCTLRRLKDVLDLPPRTYHYIDVEFNVSSRDEELYNILKVKINRAMQDRGRNSNIRVMILILRIRQMLVHRNLATPRARDTTTVDNETTGERVKFGRLLLSWDNKPASRKCGACQEPFHDNNLPRCVSACKHFFCGDCAHELPEVAGKNNCPAKKCKAQLTADQVVFLESVTTTEEEGGQEDDLDVLGFDNTRVLPQKFISIIDILKEIRKKSEKTLIFTQFPSVFPLLKDALFEEGFDVQTIHGQMDSDVCQRNLEDFKRNPAVSVILLSLNAASAGLNIVEATHVIFLDQWWNPAVEDQAVDRAHRIGQTKEVHIYHFLHKHTIETSIIKRQLHKREMAKRLLHGDQLKGQVPEENGDTSEWRRIWVDA